VYARHAHRYFEEDVMRELRLGGLDGRRRPCSNLGGRR
jgi:hypothetical protein